MLTSLLLSAARRLPLLLYKELVRFWLARVRSWSSWCSWSAPQLGAVMLGTAVLAQARASPMHTKARELQTDTAACATICIDTVSLKMYRVVDIDNYRYRISTCLRTALSSHDHTPEMMNFALLMLEPRGAALQLQGRV